MIGGRKKARESVFCAGVSELQLLNIQNGGSQLIWGWSFLVFGHLRRPSFRFGGPNQPQLAQTGQELTPRSCKTTELHEAVKAIYKQRSFNKLFPYILFWKTSSRIPISYQLLLTLRGTVSLSAVSGTHWGTWKVLPMDEGDYCTPLLAGRGQKLALSVKAI